MPRLYHRVEVRFSKETHQKLDQFMRDLKEAKGKSVSKGNTVAKIVELYLEDIEKKKST